MKKKDILKKVEKNHRESKDIANWDHLVKFMNPNPKPRCIDDDIDRALKTFQKGKNEQANDKRKNL